MKKITAHSFRLLLSGLLFMLMCAPSFVYSQHLTISNSGQTGTSGTNWSIIDNVLYIGNSEAASIHTSVITNHLQNNGDLTINLPGQSGTGRNIYINNTIAYSGSSARTLTFQSGNDIVFANAVGITSATASLNVVLRSAITTGSPDNGSVKMDGINIDTKGGHLWVGGGASTTTWNGLNVGNSAARTYLDDVAGISVVGSTIASGGGNIYMNGLSWNSGDDDGVNYGINVENSNVSSGSGSINFAGGVYGRYNNGIGMRVNGASATSITSTTGAITIYGYGTDATTNGNFWRTATMINGSVSIKSVSGNIAVTGEAAFTSPVNDKEGLVIADGSAICSQTGNITLNGTNTLESSGQYSNSIRFAAANAANSIRIGYDGTNAYSGNITIVGNSIYQRSTHLGAGSIAVQTTGILTIQPTGNSFTYMRAGDAGTLTFDNDWNFGTNLGGFVYGKSTNTTGLTYSNALTTRGPITIYAGAIVQNGAFSTTSASGHITLLSKTHITNSNATTITTQGGNVLFASNVDDATDGESTTNGYIQLRAGITVNSNGGNITFGGGNTAGSDYALGSSDIAYTEGIRFDAVIALNSGGGNIALRGKSYAMGVYTDWGASGVGFYFFSAATGIINSGTGTITIDGYSQTHTSTYAAGFYCMHNLTITSANTTSNAINITGKATGASGEAWGIESESTLSVLATGIGGGITINTSKQLPDNFDAVFRGETNILAVSGPINLKTGQLSGTTNGYLYLNGHMYLGSKAGSAVTSSSSNINMQVDRYYYANGALPKLATSGSVTIQPNGTSFGADIYTSYFNFNQNGQTMTGFTFGKSGNIGNLYLNTAVTSAGPVNVYGATIGIAGALTASGSDVSLYATTAVTQNQPVVSSGLSLNGIGTFTLTNASNNFTTLAGGAAGSLLGAIQIVDVSGGLTIGTLGSNTGLKGSSSIRVETLAGNLTLAGSISTTSTSTDAVILTSAKSTAIGIGTGGDIIVSGEQTITMGSGGIAKLFSGLESTSTGLTSLAGGSSNVRNNYDETTSTFSPVLSANNRYAIYRTSAGVGDLTIVSSNGDAINSTWSYENGIINTMTSPVNILSSVIENYLASGPLTINAGNTTVNAAITSTSTNALVLNANSTLTNTQPTTTVNAAITNAGSITINTGAFNIAHNISTTSTAAIAISAANGFSTTTVTRRTISTQGGNITLNADNDANGSGWLDIDDLTLNPGTGNLIVRGETFNVNGTESRKPYINGTGSFTFESNDTSFGQNIESAWFVIDQDANGISGLNFGKSGNTFNAYLNSVFAVAGPINVYGGYVWVSSTITSSGNSDILLKGITNSGACVNISGGITKSSGTGTLLMQGHGRVINSGTISATGTAVLNLVMWSDYDGDNVGGGSTLNGGSISTNSGHVWMGGSNSNGGSYTWNGLAVGDGPSTGASGSNCHAIDLFAPITTNGGDVFLWASNNGGCGTSGIVSDGTRHINAGSGDITLIAYQTAGAIELTSTGVISLLPHAGSYSSALTLGGTLTSGNFSFNTSHYNGLKINSLANTGLVIGNYSGHFSGATAVTQGNSSNVTVSSVLLTKSLEIHGGAIALNENITTTGTNADVLIKAISNINLASSKTITTVTGDVNLWADSDDNSNGYVQLLAGAAINSTGGDINLGGGADLMSDYAFGTTTETCPEVVGTQYISGVHMRQGSSLSSNNGNISVRGQNANTANAAMSFGLSLRGVTMNSGTGKIALNGIANGSGIVNAQAVASWGTLTLRSANTSADAISITGNALSSTGVSSLGVNIVALFEATGVGGGIIINGKSGVASTNASVNLGGDILAKSGPISISGENISGVVDNIMIGSTTTIGKKSGTNVTTSTSNVILEGNKITTAGAVSIDCTGIVTVRSFGDSFASAITWPMTNVSHSSSITGLTIGKPSNTSNITFGNATTIAGPITAYGGDITLNQDITSTASNAKILVKASGQINTIGSRTFQTNNGDFVLWSDSDNNNEGRIWLGLNNIINTANGSTISGLSGGGKIVLAGGLDDGANGGIANDNVPDGFASNSSSFGLNLGGSTSNYTQMYSGGGDIIVKGSSTFASSTDGGSGVWSDGRWLANAGKGSISINGKSTHFFGVNLSKPLVPSSNVSIGNKYIEFISDKSTGNAIEIIGSSNVSYGVVFNYENPKEVLATGGGAITITGTGGGSVQGIFLQNTDLLATAGDITMNGGSNGITVANSGTRVGSRASSAITSSSSNIRWVANSLNLSVLSSGFLNNFATSGSITIEPSSDSFTNALTFPISNLSLSNSVSGLTLGKASNTKDITFGSVTSINGPITAYGSNIAINGALTATNSSISLQASGTVTQTAAITATNLNLSGTGTFTLTNTSNNVGTIAGGTLSSKLGSLSYVDSNELSIGALTNPGIIASGKINIQTLTNNLNLNSNVVTDNTATDAIILNAGKSASIGTTTGGDIIVGGTPSVTTGTNGIAKLYSGSAVNSAGLTSLVGGLTKVRYETDETTTTFVPTLEAGNSYAFYRETITLPPTVTNQSVCSGATVSDLVATGTDLKCYSVAEGGVALNASTVLAGTTYYVSQTLSGNESTRTAVVVTITPSVGSIGSISGPASIASNVTTATYSIASVTNATSYVWNLPLGMTITSSTGNVIQLSISSAFSGGNITVKAINSCTESSVRSFAVSRQNIPLSITGASTICISKGSVTETYSVSSVEGATSYVWTVPSGSVITSGTNTNTISLTYNTSFSRGTIRVSAIGANGVISSGTLAVSGMAMPGAIIGATQICTAGTYEYSTTAVDGATSYEWVLPVGMTLQGSGVGTSITVITSSNVNGTVSVRAISSCGSSQSRTLSISGIPTPSYIYGERIICGATSNAVDINGNVTTTPQTGIYTYSVLPVLGADSYTWTLPTGVILVSGQGTRSIQVSFASSFVSGNISIVANSTSCGISPSRVVTVSSVNGSISGPLNICGLTTATYSIAAGSGSDFVWTVPQGMSIQSGEGTNSITVSIQNPINFTNNNQVSLSFTTPCGGTKVVNMTVDCPDYSNLTNCGSTVAFNERVYTRSVSGASMYAFDIYDSTTNVLLNTYETRGNFFQFIDGLSTFEFGTTYNVKVRVKKNGVYGTAGSSCSVTITAPVTAIQASQCGQTITNEDRVYAVSVWSGVMYAFDIYDNEGNFITTIEKTSNFFRMREFASVYGMSYQIGVRVKRGNGSYGAQGSRCNITIAIPTTSLVANQCGASINVTDRIYARSVANVTMYAFRIYTSNGTFIAELERPYSFFRITDISYTSGATYQVGVKVKQGEGNYGLEGTLCSITIPNDEIKREVTPKDKEEESEALASMFIGAYPNPFTTAFTITPLEGETATLFYQVYDITGKMLESKSVEVSEVHNHTIGADYPVGMYLVIARQGATTQTFKMIKQ